jgi:beta-N-acetylhexosaminidase
MTVEEKVGQLFMPYVYGSAVDQPHPSNTATYGIDTIEELIEEYHLGGVIYFGWSDNLQSIEQIAGLSNGVQRVAVESGAPVPALISIDQEEGVVVRMPAPSTQLAGTMALGAAGDPELARTSAQITGRELRAVGINQNFAPVADVNVNAFNPVIGVRSFGADPGTVASLTAAQVEGFRAANVASTAKHFPGHGNTDVDSHVGLPVIPHTADEVDAIDLPPFAAAVDAGVDGIMTAHIVVPSIDETERPATLSEPILTGLLRDRLGYDGLIVTDALTMEGVRTMFGDDRVPVEAIKAGADLMLMPPDLDVAVGAVLDAVDDGEISERRLDESVFRILRAKFERGLFDDPYADLDAADDVVGHPDHRAFAEDAADETITLVSNEGVLPFADAVSDVLVTGWGAATTDTLADHLADHGLQADAIETGEAPSEARIAEVVDAAQEADAVVVTTMSSGFAPSQGQRDLVAALADVDVPVVVVSVRNPYDIASLAPVDAYLAAYSFAEVSLRSTARVLVGEVDPTGRLPVAIPDADDPDTELFELGHGLGY